MKRRKKVSERLKARRNRRYNRLAMLGTSFVVCMLMVILLGQGFSMRKKIAANDDRLQSVEKQIKEENQRTKEIEKLEEYMQSDEYAEKTAKEKIGLVKDNEIVFKETD